MTVDEANRATARRTTARRISVTEAKALIEAGRGVLVDVRDRDAYDGVHAEGAISVPFNRITSGARQSFSRSQQSRH